MGEALQWWEQAAAQGHVYAHVELAMHYEHRLKDFETARKWAAAALDIVRSDETPGYVRDHWQSELDHRLSRLDGKINKHPVKGKGD